MIYNSAYETRVCLRFIFITAGTCLLSSKAERVQFGYSKSAIDNAAGGQTGPGPSG